jgi:hypothetical protein
VFTGKGGGFPFENIVTNPNSYSASTFAVPVASENLAKTRFAQRVREFDQKWQSGAFAGEIGKTIRALRNPLKSLRDGIHGYIRQVNKLARRPLTYSRYSRAYGQVLKNRQREALSRALTGTYLEFKFGMAPIVYDMIDAQKAFDHIVGKTHVDMARVSASAEWEYNTGIQKWPGGSLINVFGPHLFEGLAVYGECITDKFYRVSGRVRYSGALSAALIGGGARSALQLQPRNFVPTVWQLLPWSWAIDYFANVGDMLDVLSTSFGALVWCNRSQYVEVEQTLTSRLHTANLNSSPVNWSLVSYSGGSAKAVYMSRRYSRTKFNPSIMNMVPSLMFRSPSFNQGLNLAAAFHQAGTVSRILAQRYA